MRDFVITRQRASVNRRLFFNDKGSCIRRNGALRSFIGAGLVQRFNGAMDRITMPSALLSHILLPQDLRQKQVVIGHRGR
jgi:hypothetical protein